MNTSPTSDGIDAVECGELDGSEPVDNRVLREDDNGATAGDCSAAPPVLDLGEGAEVFAAPFTDFANDVRRCFAAV